MTRNKVILLGMIAAMFILLVACSGKANPAADPEHPDAANGVHEQSEQEETLPDELAVEQSESEQMEEQKEEESLQPEDFEDGTELKPTDPLEAAALVMEILKNRDMSQLAEWAHPQQGIRFSANAYVDVEFDLVFLPEEITSLIDNAEVHIWGAFAGSGDWIEMTYDEYNDHFIYDADFISLGEIALNERLGEGNTISNLDEVYPAAAHDFVEYYIDGIDPEYSGMDWRSLRLVFDKSGEELWLVGIIHDHWTI